MTIQTFEDRFGIGSQEVVAARFHRLTGDRTMPSGAVYLGLALTPQVLQGRWVIECPAAGCAGAELMADSGLFFCCNCRNADIGNAYRKVTLPPDQLRTEIEAALLERPDPATRNFLAGETVEMLMAENAAMLEDI